MEKEPISKVFLGIFALTLIIMIVVIVAYFYSRSYKAAILEDERATCPAYVCPEGGAWRVPNINAQRIEQVSSAVQKQN